MASRQQIKHKIGSVKSTRQITKAMQLVSASKLRRAQDYAARSRAYGDLAAELLARLGAIKEVDQHPMFAKRSVKNRLYVMVTSSSGLAGAYNANVQKQLLSRIREDQANKVSSHVIAIGSKGAQFVRRLSGVDMLAYYPPFGDQPTANDVQPILKDVVDSYRSGDVDEVQIIYTVSKSSISQQVKNQQLLPATRDGTTESSQDAPDVSTFEPDIETVIDQVATRLIEARIWQAIIESLASEHAMRMMAMRNATDNAGELIEDYTLEYNTARQAAITQELAEITGGAEALK